MKYSEFVKEMFPKLPAHMQAKDKIKEIAKLWKDQKGQSHKRVKGGKIAEENQQGDWLETIPSGKGLKRGRGRPKKVEAGNFLEDVLKIGKAASTGDIFGLGLQHKKEKKHHSKKSKKELNEVVVTLVHKGLKKHQRHKNIRCALEHVLHNGLNFANFKAPY